MRPNATGVPSSNGLRDIDWICRRPGCGTKLGIVDRATRSKLVVKKGDLVLHVFDAARVDCFCRKCGEINTLTRYEPA